MRDASRGFFPQLSQVKALGAADGEEPVKIKIMWEKHKFPKKEMLPSSTTNQISLTHGAFHVTEICSWDEERGFVYYIATLPGRPGVRHLFRVGDLALKGKDEEAAKPRWVSHLSLDKNNLFILESAEKALFLENSRENSKTVSFFL